MSVNKVILIGRLGRDPELRSTRSGTPVCNFSLATNRPTKERETDWHRIVVWGKAAEFAAQYLAKGRQIYLEGRMQYGEYEGRDGPVKTAEVHCHTVQFVGDAPQTGGSFDEGKSRDDGASVPPPDDDDSIPF